MSGTIELAKTLMKSSIPSLSSHMHKGQAGRIGIIGGSKQYTGAPYFAGISALKVGADIVHVFTDSDAAIPIKSYSPELIVHPLLSEENSIEKVSSWFGGIHALVVGPGLGREEKSLSQAANLIELWKKTDQPLVLDADILFLLNSRSELIKGYRKAILTPNKNEYDRLYKAIFNEDAPTREIGSKRDVESLQKLCSALGNVTIIRKGEEDIVSDGKSTVVVNDQGGNRRCGGQGDVLCGVVSVFSHWTNLKEKNDGGNWEMAPTVVAASRASAFCRETSKKTFERKKRSMLTTDMIEDINPDF